MGDRASVSFRNGNEVSPALFSHWGGMEFVFTAREYVKELKKEMAQKDKDGHFPIGRLEPRTVMVDFIRHLTKDMKRITNDLYLGVDENDGDNSDRGHFELDLSKDKPCC